MAIDTIPVKLEAGNDPAKPIAESIPVEGLKVKLELLICCGKLPDVPVTNVG